MSRDTSKLEPGTRIRVLRFLAAAEAADIDLLVTCTDRSFDEQAKLYAIGRTKPGNPCQCGKKANPIGTCSKHLMGLRVTNAKPGESWHNWNRAVDVVPLRHGKPVWDTDAKENRELWETVGALGKAEGLEWAGDWTRFREFPHFQYTEGLSLTALQAAHPKGLA